MLGGLLSVQFLNRKKSVAECVTWLPASCRVCVWTSCRTAPCQEMRGREGRAGAQKRERERWCVVVPQEVAWMTQSYRLSVTRTRRAETEERGRGRQAGDRGEREHTHFCNLITESSRLLTSASKGCGHLYTHRYGTTQLHTEEEAWHTQT